MSRSQIDRILSWSRLTLVLTAVGTSASLLGLATGIVPPPGHGRGGAAPPHSARLPVSIRPHVAVPTNWT